MITIGLTGGIGSGKSTVAKWFEEKGIPVLDADKMVHELLERDELTLKRLREEFGSGILENNGQISRPKLGKVVFGDEKARKRLEEIIHPRVIERMQEERSALQKSGIELCIWDVPLLLETGFDKFVDQVWVVWVPRDLQIKRVLERDKLNRNDVEARIAVQMALDEKCKKADVVIDNSGTEQETQRQLQEIWNRLESYSL